VNAYSSAPADRGLVGLAEKILALLDEGRFTATYKYAVLLAILDLALEKTSRTGAAPEMLVTREVAEKVLEIYWPHTIPYSLDGEGQVLLQNAGRAGAQARIITEISTFRATCGRPSSQLIHARVSAPDLYERLVRDVEWTLIEMPFPRLQQFGHGYERFLYAIDWDRGVRQGAVRAYQRGEPSDFDNRIHLLPGVGEHLVLLNGLLRPLIHREWARAVAQLNGLEESRLEQFLFGTPRIALEAVRPGLVEIQAVRCFYCEEGIGHGRRGDPVVDHFIPWARYPNNALENLVVAHDRCNSQKRDFLAAADHVQKWRRRISLDSDIASDLSTLAAELRWDSAPGRSLGVARGIYLNLPEDVPLWLRSDHFVETDPPRLAEILA